MSLISEALKKARQEAARQDAQRQRSPYAVGIADSAERRTALGPLLAGLGAGCLIAVLLVAVAWSAGWGPFAKHAKKAVQVTAAAPSTPAQTPVTRPAEPAAVPPAMIEEQASPSPVQSAAPPPPVQEPRPQPVIEVRPAAPAETPAPRPAPPISTPAPAAEERAPAPTVPAAPAPSPSPTPARPSPATPPPGAMDLVDGQSYVGEVPVPGGGRVKLNGIVFSREQPVAMLDGRVMAPGEIIQGFTLVAVESGRVKLQGYGATVFVSPK